jgi:hypothetical protein
MKNKVFILTLAIFLQCKYFEDAKSKSNYFLKFLGIAGANNTSLSVSSVYPKDKSTDNYLNTNVFLVFNKNISGFSNSNFQILTDANIQVEGRIEMKEKILSFYPKNIFSISSAYKIVLKAENGLDSEKNYTFTTGSKIDTTPPSLVNSIPSNAEKDIPVNISINATISEEFDPNSLTSNVYKVIDVEGSLSYLERTIVFTPRANLQPNSNVIVVLNPGLKDMAGNAMTTPSAWIFTTGELLASDCLYDVNYYNNCKLK